MARKRYTEEQIIAVLNEAEAGAKTGELCRRHGMSEGAFYKWKTKYAGLTLSELKRLRSLEEENRRLSLLLVFDAPEPGSDRHRKQTATTAAFAGLQKRTKRK